MCDHDRPNPSRVAARYLIGSRDLLSSQGMKLLSIFTKGGKGTVGMETVQEVMDALDGWSLEQGVGAAKLGSINNSERLAYLLAPLIGMVNPRRERFAPWAVWPTDRKEPAKLSFESWDTAEEIARDLKSATESCGSKGPSNPQAGKVYAWKIGKPRTPEWGGRFKAEIPVGQFWIGVPAWKLTAPNGKSVDLLLPMDYRGQLAPPGNTKMPQLFTFGYRNGLQESAQDLLAQMGESGAEAVLPKSQRTRENTGTCPVCFRNIKLANGRMVLHGYSRPPSWGVGRSHGPHEGQCFGVGYPPYELSSEGCQAYLDKALKPALKKAKTRLRDLQSGKITELHVEKGYGWDRKTVSIGPDHEKWDRVLQSAIQGSDREVRNLEMEIKRYTGLIKSWSVSPLPGEPGWRRPSPVHGM